MALASDSPHIPATRKGSLFMVLTAVSVVLMLPYLFFNGLPEQLELLIFGLLVVVTGIPHGAVDHIVASRVYGLTDGFADQAKFYASYLLAMCLIGGLWVMWPVGGLLFFLAISVYHFGQGDLEWLRLKGARRYLLFISRGILIIGIPVFGHLSITAPIIYQAAGTQLTEVSWIAVHAYNLALFAWFQHLVLLGLFVLPLPGKQKYTELFLGVLLGAVLLFTHPLVGFAIYFGLWHSLNHFFEMRDHIHDDGIATFSGIYKKTIPFTVVSLLGLYLIWFVMDAFEVTDKMVSLLFILISVLTFPHMIVVDGLFRKSGHIR